MALADGIKNITTATTTVVDEGSGVLRRIVVNTSAAGTVTIYDNTSAAGDKIATLTTTAASSPASVLYDVVYLTGLTVVTSAAVDLTVVYIPNQ